MAITRETWELGLSYNAPNDQLSSIDASDSYQQRTHYWIRKAITDTAKKRFFTQMASSIDMPKHMGKRVEVYQYIPLLDDRNVNDQGIDATGAHIDHGNLWGSSHDIGYITKNLPTLGEQGGRVNRIGFTRKVRSGSLQLYGFFYEFTREAIDFDSDNQLMQHLSTETFKGLNEIQEQLLALDLLAAAGVNYYGGDATSEAEITGESDASNVPSNMTWELLEKLDATLTKNRCERHIKMLTGSMNTDTVTVASGRVMYIGPELVPAVKRIKDWNGEPAFLPIEKYGSQTKPMIGEIGTVGNWHFIEVPEMLMKEAAGAAVGSANAGYRSAEDSAGTERYNVYYALSIGSDSFNTIGFGIEGSRSAKVKTITKMPGRETASLDVDPYGMRGFCSSQFYYGFFCRRPEWIAKVSVVAPL